MTSDPSTVDERLDALEKLAEQVERGERSRLELLQSIEAEQEQLEGDSAFAFLLAGEKAFYEGEYENALKHYLKAKELPIAQFFCFRTSAHIAHKRGNNGQAMKFAHKAQTLRPDDPSIKAMLEAPMNYTETKYPNEEGMECEDSPFSQDNRFASPSIGDGFQSFQEEMSFPQRKVDLLTGAEKALEMRIQNFQRQRAHYLSQYAKRSRQRARLDDCCLYVFNGWDQQPARPQPFEEQDDESWGYFFLNSQMRKPSCGFYLRWNGKGIVINPGRRFLECFHRSGLHIADIDIVIVTQKETDSYIDVQQIYELNYQLNKINSELQIIHYYLNQAAHLELSPILKPNFKQERNAIHPLELFVDSPEVERVELTPDVTLHYFPTSTQEALSHHQQIDKGMPQRTSSSSLGIRLDMRFQQGEQKKMVKMGYISGTPWSPLLGHHLGHCDLLFAGFGNTHLNDFGKLNYNDHCLGYFGSYSLVEEVKPRLFFCCEFDGREGDIRLEVSRKMRQELADTQAVLPADNGLFVDLRDLHIRCSVSQVLVDPMQIRVVKSGESFSSLLYLSPNCLLD